MSRNRYPVAVHLLFLRADTVLLSRRYQTGWHDGEYSVPAGHAEAGETVTQASAREAREEVGLDLNAADLQVVHVMHRASDAPADETRATNDERIDFFLAVRAWQGEPVNAEPEKCDDLRWYGVDALPENTVPYVRHALKYVRDGVWYSEFGW
jgi:8-oxo-dGTP diphosphatase